jgi:hypothetical protein
MMEMIQDEEHLNPRKIRKQVDVLHPLKAQQNLDYSILQLIEKEIHPLILWRYKYIAM